jgi:hypothetical protein
VRRFNQVSDGTEQHHGSRSPAQPAMERGSKSHVLQVSESAHCQTSQFSLVIAVSVMMVIALDVGSEQNTSLLQLDLR